MLVLHMGMVAIVDQAPSIANQAFKNKADKSLAVAGGVLASAMDKPWLAELQQLDGATHASRMHSTRQEFKISANVVSRATTEEPRAAPDELGVTILGDGGLCASHDARHAPTGSTAALGWEQRIEEGGKVTAAAAGQCVEHSQRVHLYAVLHPSLVPRLSLLEGPKAEALLVRAHQRVLCARVCLCCVCMCWELYAGRICVWITKQGSGE
jgi:hypothetical protein